MRSSDRVSFVSSPHTMDQPPNGFAAGGACEIKSLFPSPASPGFIIFPLLMKRFASTFVQVGFFDLIWWELLNLKLFDVRTRLKSAA